MVKNISYFVVAVAVLALLGGLLYFLIQQQETTPGTQQLQQPTSLQESGLGSELNQNPGSKVPETNPLEGYINPFE